MFSTPENSVQRNSKHFPLHKHHLTLDCLLLSRLILPFYQQHNASPDFLRQTRIHRNQKLTNLLSGNYLHPSIGGCTPHQIKSHLLHSGSHEAGLVTR